MVCCVALLIICFPTSVRLILYTSKPNAQDDRCDLCFVIWLQEDGGLINVIAHADALTDVAAAAGVDLKLNYQVVGLCSLELVILGASGTTIPAVAAGHVH